MLGVMSANGVSGGPLQGSDLWTVLFTFLGWRQVGGRLKESELVIRKPVKREEITRLQQTLAHYEVVRVRARLCEESVFDSPQALLIDILGKDESDAEMNAYARKLQEPVTFEDSEFGVFTLDRRVDWFCATPHWGDIRVQLTILKDKVDEMQKSLAVARALWSAQPEWQKKITDYVVAELLTLKNDTWLGDEETELTAHEFIDRMTLETISTRGDERFEFWYDDGDLFCGHAIMVSGNLKDGPDNAGIHG